MGKHDVDGAMVEQELTKLQAQMHQSAQDVTTYLEALKHGLSEYDHKYHQHLSASASSFFSDGLDNAKDAVKLLKHTAEHVQAKEVGEVRAESQVDSCWTAMEQAFNALADLQSVASAYDSEHPLTPTKHGDKEEKRVKHSTSDSVVWLVSSTRDVSFSGFAPLHKQLLALDALLKDHDKPSIKERAKEALHHVKDKLHRDSKSSTGSDERDSTEARKSS